MDGLLIKFLTPQLESPGRSFWSLFEPIRAELDGMYWCFSNQAWMGAPDVFDWETVMEPFAGQGQTEVSLWRPHTLAMYADTFAEEYIELWGVDAPADKATRLAAAYNASYDDRIMQENADAWLHYMDSTCWEIYAKETYLVDSVYGALSARSSVAVFKGWAEERRELFARAGLADFWSSFTGQ